MTKILLVNEDSAALGTLRLALQSEQCWFIQASTGSAALQAIREQHPDLVVTDAQLPDVTGLELCRQIKAQPAQNAPFVVIITSSAVSESERIQGLEAGADDYIVQPISKRELLARVNILLRIRAAEDELRQYKTLLETAGRVARFGGWKVYLADNRVTWSDQVAAIHEMPPGYSPSLEEGIQFYAPEWREKITTLTNQCRQMGTPFDEELQIVTAAGKRIWVRATGQAVYDAAGQIVAIEGSFQDINERKQSETLLRANDARYRSLVEYSPDAIFVNRNDRVALVNQACLTLFGATSPEQLLGKSPYELFDHSDHAAIQERIHQLREKGQAVGVREEKIVRLDGSLVTVEVTAAPFPDPGENSIHVVLRDITERKQAEAELQESNALLSLFIKHSPVYAYIKTVTPTESRVLTVSGNFEEMVGIPASKMVGKTMQEIFPSVFATKMTDDDWAVVSQGKVLSLDEELNGRHYTSIKFPITLGQKKLLAGYTIDITERVQAEAEIRTLNAELEARVEQRARQLQEAQARLVRQERLAVLGQLAGGVGHELRTPLSVISNAVYFLNLVQPDANEKVKEYLALIQEETHKAENIINDLLDFARIKAATQQVMGVPQLIANVLNRYPVPANVQLTLALPDDLPTIFADPRHMEQVLGNLVVNACQAMPEGGKLTITAGLQVGEIAIVVQDTGSGITPENMPLLFEPLFTTKPRGIGLGLPICKNLMEANNGRIEVYSTAGQGATFIMRVPAAAESRMAL